MGESQRGGRNARAVPVNHRMARIAAGNKEASGGKLTDEFVVNIFYLKLLTSQTQLCRNN